MATKYHLNITIETETENGAWQVWDKIRDLIHAGCDSYDHDIYTVELDDPEEE